MLELTLGKKNSEMVRKEYLHPMRWALFGMSMPEDPAHFGVQELGIVECRILANIICGEVLL
jgi:hypothetical protein